MTATTEERPVFENEEWLVTESGLEHKTTGYFIERESLGNRRDDGLWSWPLHMAEKSWCRMAPFAEAFSCAAAIYHVDADVELAQTFNIARCEVSTWPQPQKAVFNPAPLMSGALRKEVSPPILWKQGSSEKPLKGQGLQNPEEALRIRPQTGARPSAATLRFRPSQPAMARNVAFPWRAPRQIRKTGTRLVQLLQAAWNIR